MLLHHLCGACEYQKWHKTIVTVNIVLCTCRIKTYIHTCFHTPWIMFRFMLHWWHNYFSKGIYIVSVLYKSMYGLWKYFLAYSHPASGFCPGSVCCLCCEDCFLSFQSLVITELMITELSVKFRKLKNLCKGIVKITNPVGNYSCAKAMRTKNTVGTYCGTKDRQFIVHYESHHAAFAMCHLQVSKKRLSCTKGCDTVGMKCADHIMVILCEIYCLRGLHKPRKYLYYKNIQVYSTYIGNSLAMLSSSVGGLFSFVGCFHCGL